MGKTKRGEKTDERNWQSQYSSKCLHASIKTERSLMNKPFVLPPSFLQKKVELSISSQSIFSFQELSSLDKSKIPFHVGIIPDGNRRWAKKQLLDYEEGHI